MPKPNTTIHHKMHLNAFSPRVKSLVYPMPQVHC